MTYARLYHENISYHDVEFTGSEWKVLQDTWSESDMNAHEFLADNNFIPVSETFFYLP